MGENNQKSIKIKFIYLETVFFLHTGIIGAVYVLYLLSKGLSIFEANMVSAIFNIASICFEVPSGALSDSIGKRKTALLAGVTLFIAMVSFQVGINITIIILGQLFWGVSYALESGTIEAWLVNEGNYKDAELDKIFAVSRKIQSIIMILGSFVGTWLANYSLDYIWFIPCLTSVIFIIMVSLFIEEENKNHSKQSVFSLYKMSINYIKVSAKMIAGRKKIAYIYGFITIMSFVSSPLMIFWSVYLTQIDKKFSYMYLSIMWFLIQLAIFLGNQLLEFIGKKVKRKWIIVFSLFIFGLSSICMNIGKKMIIAVFFICIQEIVWAIISSVQRGLLNDYIDNQTRTTLISFSSLFNSIGKIIASVLFGLFADRISILFSWTLSGILAFASVVYVILMYKIISK